MTRSLPSASAIALALAAAAALVSPAVAQQTGGRSSGAPTIEQQVISASNEWASALERGDADAVDRLLRDDVVMIQQAPNGVAMLGKAVQVEALRKNAATRGKISRQIDRVRVRTYGNVAILTAAATYSGTSAAGVTASAQAVISEVWVSGSDGWRLSHFQATGALPASRPPAGGR